MIIAWVAWFFVAPQVYWLDRLLAGTFAAPLDLDLAVALVLGLFARPSALPGLLLGAALGRSLFDQGPLALHFLALGLPVALLIPLRTMFFRGSLAWQCAAAAFLALAVPRVAMFFGRVAGQVGPELSGGMASAVFWSALCVPPLAWVLRHLPPLRSFMERAT